jgi:hypothetical protein
MKINEEEQVHGAVLRRLLIEVGERSPQLMVKLHRNELSRSSYQLDILDLKTNAECTVGLFIKFSTARRSPWRFSFTDLTKVSIEVLNKTSIKTFVIFASVEDGIACIDSEKLGELLSLQSPSTESVQLKGKPKESYRISGSDGKIEKILPRNSFPQVIVSLLAKI